MQQRSSDGTAGSNRLCSTQPTRRIRKEWRSLTEGERDLFLVTMETAFERRLISKFIDYHSYPRSAFQAHATCGFALWHMRFLLAVEDMLRDIDPPRTSCLTIPYWDVSIDYARQNSTGSCFSLASCAPGLFLEMMGGVSGFFGEDINFHSANQTTTIRQYSKLYTISGTLVQDRPVSRLLDDQGRPGFVRDDIFRVPLPPSASSNSLRTLIQTHPDYDSFTTTLQRGVHDDVHSAIGGFMSTFASPVDVFFWVWHSTTDLFYMLWQECHRDSLLHLKQPDTEFMGSQHCQVRPLWATTTFELGGPPPLENPEGISLQPRSTEDIVMEGEFNGSSIAQDIRQDEQLGKYFVNLGLSFEEVADASFLSEDSSFTYELLNDERSIWKQMFKDGTTCPSLSHPKDLENVFTTQQQSTSSLEYPHLDLELLVEEWVANLFPIQGETLREPDDVLVKRRQYLSCSILHTRGTLLSDSTFLKDLENREPTIRNGPDRCHGLWPGSWVELVRIPTEAPALAPDVTENTAASEGHPSGFFVGRGSSAIPVCVALCVWLGIGSL